MVIIIIIIIFITKQNANNDHSYITLPAIHVETTWRGLYCGSNTSLNVKFSPMMTSMTAKRERYEKTR